MLGILLSVYGLKLRSDEARGCNKLLFTLHVWLIQAAREREKARLRFRNVGHLLEILESSFLR